jgi:hypothetical protein
VDNEAENPDVFRKAFKEIRDEEYFGAHKMIDLASLTGRISAATLNRFINGAGGHTMGRHLRTIARTLMAHPEFKRHFERSDPTDSSVVSANATDPFDLFVAGMTQLFSDQGRMGTKFPLDSKAGFGERLVGDYVLYRPSWRPFVENKRYSQEIMVSVLNISKSPFGYVVSDSQDFIQEGSKEPFIQRERGCLVAAGHYLYFLMKEISGTTVRLALIQNLLDIDPKISIGHFQGIFYTSSHLAIYPPAKFFCRRTNGSPAVQLGPRNPREIADVEARNYIADPLPPPLQFIPKARRR